MRKKKRGKRFNKAKIAVLLFIVSVVILTAAALYSSQPRIFEKKPAEEYFRIFDATVDYGEPRFNDNNEMIAVVIYTFRFKIEAVGGDAHSVNIFCDIPSADPADLLDMKKGENQTVVFEALLGQGIGYLSEKNDEGKFPFPIRITSDEAEGTIIILS